MKNVLILCFVIFIFVVRKLGKTNGDIELKEKNGSPTIKQMSSGYLHTNKHRLKHIVS